MKSPRLNRIHVVAAFSAAAIFISGCAQQQQQRQQASAGGTHGSASKAAPAPKASAPARADGYGPSYSSFEEGGSKFVRGSMAFPSGRLEGSGLLLEKVVPAEAMVGVPFTYRYHVKNLTPNSIHQVMVTDRVTQNFSATSANPKPATVNGGLATWALDSLGPNETKVITVTGSSSEEGTVTTCGWATYSPILCEPIKILKPALELVKKLTPEAIICDPVNMTLTVRNSGSSTLHDVSVSDELPSGLTTSDGKTSITSPVGTLRPGESKDIPVALKAGRPGKFDNTAKATSREGVSAQASATTVVRQAVISLTCTAPSERFLGRPGDFCFKISNTGDAACPDAVIEATLPAGVTLQSSTGGGTAAGGKVTWRVGTLGAGQSKEVCATVVSAAAGQVSISATANGGCAKPATATCQTTYRGIAAVLLEVIDVSDPIEVGANETYEVVVTNQGTAPLTNVKLSSKLEASQQFVSGSGSSAVSGSGSPITYGTVASIPAKGKASWKVVVKATKGGDVRFHTILNSDQTERPVEETESTHQY